MPTMFSPSCAPALKKRDVRDSNMDAVDCHVKNEVLSPSVDGLLSFV